MQFRKTLNLTTGKTRYYIKDGLGKIKRVSRDYYYQRGCNCQVKGELYNTSSSIKTLKYQINIHYYD